MIEELAQQEDEKPTKKKPEKKKEEKKRASDLPPEPHGEEGEEDGGDGEEIRAVVGYRKAEETGTERSRNRGSLRREFKNGMEITKPVDAAAPTASRPSRARTSR